MWIPTTRLGWTLQTEREVLGTIDAEGMVSGRNAIPLLRRGWSADDNRGSDGYLRWHGDEAREIWDCIEWKWKYLHTNQKGTDKPLKKWFSAGPGRSLALPKMDNFENDWATDWLDD